ncbi:beta-ketoacyl-ACP synthase II [Paludicola sp. MB14-C6]|uniref:beta-ketoacyl-ACP synthase II n=1 Tax=Paludihabitans sp. MB14-C6 TaxID=3070656 RepID=UPI0027DC7C7E|nr:beta-ketoacyl-ACP synthase II [Paludicola sp. MB14-C6]WMJ21871.1 beta-ketoacyl-ACP synthase II [Paludicola sp. MB14-C6]
MKRVVITGMGAISPIGTTVDSFFDSIKSGKHGIAPITSYDTSNSEVKLAAEVKDFDPLQYFDKKELRRTDRFNQFAIAAATQAVEDCGTKFEDLDPFRIGVIVGSGIGGFQTIEQEYNKFLEKGGNRVSVFFVPMMITNMAAGSIAMKYGFKGVNYAPVTACATSSHAIGEAFRAIKHGYADAVVTGGSEAAITEFSIAGFNNMKALCQSEDVNRASIPFDKERNGFVMGEGGAILVLEELEHAKARGAKIYAEIVGYGATGDAYHMTSPDPEGRGAAKAMELAYTEAGITADKVDYINAHGTSTGLNDKYETIAIKSAFGDHANTLAISSTKSMTGHLLGAAGAIEAIVCAKSLQEGIIPATIGYQVADEECDLDYVTEGLRKQDIQYAISNSLGFGGHNASLCFKKYQD